MSLQKLMGSVYIYGDGFIRLLGGEVHYALATNWAPNDGRQKSIGKTSQGLRATVLAPGEFLTYFKLCWQPYFYYKSN
eukprot:1157160-Pelagomonas_calceolata.AAC.4